MKVRVMVFSFVKITIYGNFTHSFFFEKNISHNWVSKYPETAFANGQLSTLLSKQYHKEV